MVKAENLQIFVFFEQQCLAPHWLIVSSNYFFKQQYPAQHHGGCPVFPLNISLCKTSWLLKFEIKPFSEWWCPALPCPTSQLPSFSPCIFLFRPSVDCSDFYFYPAKKALRLIGIVFIFWGGTQRFCNAGAMLHGILSFLPSTCCPQCGKC